MPRMTKAQKRAELLKKLEEQAEKWKNYDSLSQEEKDRRAQEARDRMDEKMYRYGYKIGCQPTSDNLSFALDGLSYADKKIFRKGYKDAQTYTYGYERDMIETRDRMTPEERAETRKGGY
jgi:hypothetical protein